MVLKDFQCSECYHMLEDVESDQNLSEFEQECPSCLTIATFHSACNGGTKTLPFGIGLDSRDWGDSVKFAGFEASKTDGTPLPSGILDKINNPDRQAAHLDKIKFDKKQKKGQGKLFF